MLMRIERSEAVDTTQGREKQRLKAAPQRLLPVLQQGKGVIGMRVLVSHYRLLELGHDRAKCPLLIEPMGKKMHAHKRQTECDADNLCARGDRRAAFSVARTALGPIKRPLHSQPIEMANAHWHQSLSLGNLCEQLTARARRVLLKQLPQSRLVN